jgi:hypothetical protein
MFLIDLRPGVPSRPRRYAAPRIRWSARRSDVNSTPHSSSSTPSDRRVSGLAMASPSPKVRIPEVASILPKCAQSSLEEVTG